MDDPDLRTRLDRYLARQAGQRPPSNFENHILERVPVAARSRRWVPEAVAVLVAAAMIGGLFVAVRGTQPSPTSPPASSPIPEPAVLSGAGAQVAWLLIQMQNQQHEVGIVGVDPRAHIVRKLVPFGGMRSGDGNRLIASPFPGQQIQVISAATGEVERTVVTQLNGGIRSVSWDGRFAVGEKGTQVELVDVDAGRSLGIVDLGPAGGGVLGVSRDGKHVYVCCKAQKLTSLVWDGTSLRVEAQALDGKDGHRLPSCGSPPATSRMLPDGRTLVAYCPDGNRVWWLDLERLTVTKELPVEQGNPFWLAPIWAPDGSMLYLHEPRTNSFQAVDLRRQTLVLKTKLAVARTPDPLRWLAERFVISAEAGCVGQTGAVSPDGQSLYLLDGRGLSVRRLPDLSVKSYWRRDSGMDALWLSGDGGTLYASDHDRVSVFGGDGRLVAEVKPGASISGCAW
jgi:hypothetical protein